MGSEKSKRIMEQKLSTLILGSVEQVQQAASKISKTGEPVNLAFFYSREIIFEFVMYFYMINMINCLTLE